MNNALERVRKEAAVVLFEVIFRHVYVETEGLHETLSQDNRCPD
jgi:hypothetical protein